MGGVGVSGSHKPSVRDLGALRGAIYHEHLPCERDDDGLADGPRAEPVPDLLQMILDGLRLEAEQQGDLRLLHPARVEAKHFQLSRREHA